MEMTGKIDELFINQYKTSLYPVILNQEKQEMNEESGGGGG
jgi:hypothetical protein